MASTNKTTNYELSQFEGTDKPSWEADYNADMLAIDTNLKSVSDVADGASGSISSLADRVTTAEGNITTNANDIDALEARADALEAGETAADGRLDAIEAEQIVQNTAIESNTRLGYNLARPYDSASTYSVGAYVLFQDTLYKCTTAVTTGESFDPTKWLAIKATDEIAAGGYTLPTASANVLGGVKVGSGLAIDGSGVLSAASSGFTYTDNFISITPDANYPISNYTIVNQKGYYDNRIFIFNAVISGTLTGAVNGGFEYSISPQFSVSGISFGTDRQMFNAAIFNGTSEQLSGDVEGRAVGGACTILHMPKSTINAGTIVTIMINGIFFLNV